MDDLKRVSFKTQLTWELGGESVIFTETLPNPPRAGEETLIRITHSNVYCPIEDTEFFIRVGDPDNPTAWDVPQSASDWIKAELVEEIVSVDGEQMHRSQANEPFGREQEVPWDGTFEARLTFAAGKASVEINVVSQGMVQSGVIADWHLTVEEAS